ncbi:remodeling and spacing factor 1 isoform X2 [Oncorhynchus mykiss]|uniref:remodeling and spacing factor 1 isoform X2 n=1 Tax=Oncorhynchus mykiss TaxID=8022 RepID=UPI0018787B50|nr:remodeling and spacing factor 1 isoform X2 [Oncorhynchus mykiss]
MAASAPSVGFSDLCPSYAVICSFLERYGALLDLPELTFPQLERYLQDTSSVPKLLVDLHVKLLRKIGKSVSADRWEKYIVKVCHEFNSTWAWELENKGYKDMSVECKTGILKHLCECQFDDNVKFKTAINEEDPDKMRLHPIGKDKDGLMYWFQLDQDNNVRVYVEEQDDLDGSSWKCIVRDRNSLAEILAQLKTQIDPALLTKKEGEEEDENKKTGGEGEIKKTEDTSGDEEDKLSKYTASLVSPKTENTERKSPKEESKLDESDAKSPSNGLKDNQVESESTRQSEKPMVDDKATINTQAIKEELMEVSESKESTGTSATEPLAEKHCVTPQTEQTEEAKRKTAEELQRVMKNDQQAKIPLKKREMKLSEDFDNSSGGGSRIIVRNPSVAPVKDAPKVEETSKEVSVALVGTMETKSDQVNGDAQPVTEKSVNKGMRESPKEMGIQRESADSKEQQTKAVAREECEAAEASEKEKTNLSLDMDKKEGEKASNAEEPMEVAMADETNLQKTVPAPKAEKESTEALKKSSLKEAKSSSPLTKPLTSSKDATSTPEKSSDLKEEQKVKVSKWDVKVRRTEHKTSTSIETDKNPLSSKKPDETKGTDSSIAFQEVNLSAFKETVVPKDSCPLSVVKEMEKTSIIKATEKLLNPKNPETSVITKQAERPDPITDKPESSKRPESPAVIKNTENPSNKESTEKCDGSNDIKTSSVIKKTEISEKSKDAKNLASSKETNTSSLLKKADKPVPNKEAEKLESTKETNKSLVIKMTVKPEASKHTEKCDTPKDIMSALTKEKPAVSAVSTNTNVAPEVKKKNVLEKNSKKTAICKDETRAVAAVTETQSGPKDMEMADIFEKSNQSQLEGPKKVEKWGIPKDTLKSTMPKYAEKSAKLATPKDAEKMATPKDAEKMATPKDAEKMATPKDAEKLATPKDAEKLATPKDAEKMATPKDSEKLTTPKEAEKLATPKDAEKLATPKEAEKLATPKEAEKLATPKEAEKLATPKEAEKLATPKEAEKLATPKEAEKWATPKEAEKLATPKEAEKLATPKEAEKLATPKEAEKLATPKEAEKLATPKEAEKLATPKEAEKLATPKDAEKLPKSAENAGKSATPTDAENSAKSATPIPEDTEILATPEEAEKSATLNTETASKKIEDFTICEGQKPDASKETEKLADIMPAAAKGEKHVAFEDSKQLPSLKESVPVGRKQEEPMEISSEKSTDDNVIIRGHADKGWTKKSVKSGENSESEPIKDSNRMDCNAPSEKQATSKKASSLTDAEGETDKSQVKVIKEDATTQGCPKEDEKEDDQAKKNDQKEDDGAEKDNSTAAEKLGEAKASKGSENKEDEKKDAGTTSEIQEEGIRLKIRGITHRRRAELQRTERDSGSDTGETGRSLRRSPRICRPTPKGVEFQDRRLEKKETTPPEEEEDEEEETVQRKPREKVDQDGQSKSKGRRRRKTRWSNTRTRRRKKNGSGDDNESESSEEESEEDDSDESFKVEKGKRRWRNRNRERHSDDSDTSSDDDLPPNEDPCKHCGLPNHPELILLCDSCDSGYHTACLRPPLMIIPDGEWFCSPCQHKLLCDKLEEQLANLDAALKKRDRAERRKERLVYVGISVENIITPSLEVEEEKEEEREEEVKKEKKEKKEKSKSWGRRSTRAKKSISYRFDEFDEAIEEAIEEDIREADGGGAGRGKDMANITGHSRGKDMSTILAAGEVGEGKENGRPPRPNAGQRRKKRRRLNDLDSDSTVEEEESEDEFRLSDSTEEEEFVASDKSDAESEVAVDSNDDSDFGSTRRRTARTRRPAKCQRSTRPRRRLRARGYSDDEEEETSDEDEDEIMSEGSSEFSDSDLDCSQRRSRRSHTKRQVNYCESSGDSDGSKAGTNRDKVKPRRRLASSDSEASSSRGSDDGKRERTRLKRRADSSEEESQQRRRRLSLKRRRASEEDDDDSDESSEGERPVRKRVNRIDSDDSDKEEEKEETKEEEEGGVLGKGASPLDYNLVELHPPTNGQSPIKALEGLAHIGPQKPGATAVTIAPNGLELAPQDDDEDDLLGVTDLVDFVCNSDVL